MAWDARVLAVPVDIVGRFSGVFLYWVPRVHPSHTHTHSHTHGDARMRATCVRVCIFSMALGAITNERNR